MEHDERTRTLVLFFTVRRMAHKRDFSSKDKKAGALNVGDAVHAASQRTLDREPGHHLKATEAKLHDI